MNGSERYSDGDTPDTAASNTCSSDGCNSFVLTREDFCMGCIGNDNGNSGPGSDRDVGDDDE